MDPAGFVRGEMKMHKDEFDLRAKGKVLSSLEPCFDLISGSSLSMKIQIMGGKITQNLGFKSLFQEVFFFSFYFQSLHKKVDIFYFNHFLYFESNVENLCFY